MSLSEIWRQRAWVWVPALLFFLANATAFTVYRFGFADRVASLHQDLEERQKELAPVEERGRRLEQLIQRSSLNRRLINQLYNERFATRSRRLTGITAEVKRLARQAGLDPRSLSYPEERIEEFSLVKRSFIFSVEGTYLELRRFINLLELSPSFLTLEKMSLSGNVEGGEELRIDLQISTLFAREPGAEEEAPLASRLAPGGVS